MARLLIQGGTFWGSCGFSFAFFSLIFAASALDHQANTLPSGSWYATCILYISSWHDWRKYHLDSLLTDIPNRFSVAVMMERSAVTNNPWIDHQWSAVAVTVDSRRPAPAARRQQVHRENGLLRELHRGFEITLHCDECESYYHNLISEQPRCYVIAIHDESGVPLPRLVTLSFDEAHAYMEGEGELFAVEVAPELYRWTEAFVLANYVPEKRRKRKRTNWTGEGGGEA